MSINPVNRVLMHTSKGEIEIELYPEDAPATVKNFLHYVQSGFYTGTTFHRVIDGFMIQGGGYTPDLQRKDTTDPVQNEADNGLCNTKGTIAMARRAEKHSATAQFYFNLNNNPSLDHKDDTDAGFGYCVFGEVLRGMDVVNAIAEVEVGSDSEFHNVPIQTVLINNIVVKDDHVSELPTI